jgi:MOB kinase activator 1
MLNVDVTESIRLPDGENLNDWLSASIYDFYNELTAIYAMISRSCTAQTCPEMSAGPSFKYFWQDNRKFKKPTMLPAPQYVTNVFMWAEKLMNNEQIFPSSEDQEYPAEFLDVVKNIFKRLFRVYAHCYHHHLVDFRTLEAETTLNAAFRHFALFVKEFDLIPDPELGALREVYDHYTGAA